MNEKSSPLGPFDPQVEAAAAEWLVQHDRGLTPEQQDAFLQWLAARPEHRESFQRHQEMWREFNGLAQWRPEHSAEPNADLLARLPRSRRKGRLVRWAVPSLLAAAAAIALLFVRPLPREAGDQPLTYAAAAYRQEKLADGSTLDLNRGAQVVVHFSAQERRIALVEGEVQFTVAKDPARPFVVRAGGVDVRAVGTAFNVKLAGAHVEVLVTEGVVDVAQPATNQPVPRAATSRPEKPAGVLARLDAGRRTVIPLAPTSTPPPVEVTSAAEIDRLLAWKPRLLDFDATPLTEVVATFNRSNVTQLTIADPAIGTLPIVASIRSDNLDGFVRLLEATMGVRAERRLGEIVLHQAR